MQGYILFRNDRLTHAGGIVAYENCRSACKRLSQFHLPLDSLTEIMWLQMRPTRLPRQISIMLLGIVYHPPRVKASDNEVLYKQIQRAIDEYSRDHPERLIWIVGDFNPTTTNI